MDINSELEIIQIQASHLQDIERLKMLKLECEDLVNKSVIHYYTGSVLCALLDENYPNWKFEAQDIVENPKHEVYDICEISDYTREDIHEIAKIECAIARVSEVQSEAEGALSLINQGK